ncbi:heterokaryon incompatibility protein-domain-containing protein [Trametes polyzona]|nr:heterokaryon incompatibility protein-domain-containing protein [Trametes polyzona]
MASRRARQRYRRRLVRKRRIRQYFRGPTVDPRTLPPCPPNACRFCWRGPCAAGFRSMPTELSKGETRYDYAVSFAGLRDRARRGCVWCRALAKETQAQDPHEQPRTTTSFPFLDISGVRIYLGRRVHTGIRSPHYLRHYFGLQAYAFGDDPTAGVTPWCPLLIDVGSLRALTFAKECIEHCSGEHPDCRSCLPTSPSTLPTRLIDCRDVNRPRLVTTTPGAHGKYVALSYVWGGPQDEHHTTKDNTVAYHDGIDATTLPQTIRDAIYVTHALGIDSLWLDSLCIVQDSAEDKHREMGSMRHIYHNAYVTIIAASASSVTEGFLHMRPPPAPIISSLPVICPPAETIGGPQKQAGGSRASSQLVGTLHIASRTLIEPEEPIDERAWCLQELLMSPRALIFTSTTLLYRCQTTTVNVGGAYHDTNGDIPRLPNCVLAGRPINPLVSAEVRDSVPESWRDVVQQYSLRSLSFPGDKLVACAGLADEYQAVLGSDYLAGLWRDSLLHDLLWRKWYRKSGSRPEQYRAPSWSWASLDGDIHWAPLLIHQEVATVVECTVTVEDEQVPLGPVTDGRLVLRAPLIRCRPRFYCRGNSSFLLLETADQARSCHQPEGNGVICGLQYLGHVEFDTEADQWLNRMWAVPILVDSDDDMQCLVVALDDAGPTRRLAASEDGQPVYRRIGCGRMATQNMQALGWDEGRLESERRVIVIV